MTRDEHLEWCKKRALEYVDRGNNVEGMTSMMSDLTKHAELENHAGIQLGVVMMMLPGWLEDTRRVREFILGFH